MIQTSLLLYCFAAGGVGLLIISLLTEFITYKLQLFKGIPDEMLEKNSPSWFTLNYIMEFLFYVVIPSIGYSFLFIILPFEGSRVGIAAGLFALVLGAVPIVMILSVRVKLPMAYLTFLLLTYFIKLVSSLIIIGYIYSL